METDYRVIWGVTCLLILAVAAFVWMLSHV